MLTQEEARRRIKDIQRELAALGPMRPGSLSKQYNVCGSPGCRCKDPKHPKKHGPYYHLNDTWRGKSRTEFVKAEAVEGLRRQLENYKRFRQLNQEWVDLEMERERLERAAGKKSDGN
jgi:hypothetical protein